MAGYISGKEPANLRLGRLFDGGDRSIEAKNVAYSESLGVGRGLRGIPVFLPEPTRKGGNAGSGLPGQVASASATGFATFPPFSRGLL